MSKKSDIQFVRGRYPAISVGVLLSVVMQGATAQIDDDPVTSGSVGAMSGFVLSPAAGAKVGKAGLAASHEDEMRGFELSSPASSMTAEEPLDPSMHNGAASMRGFVLSPSSAAANGSPSGQNEQSAQDKVEDKMHGFALSSPVPAAKAKDSGGGMHGIVLAPRRLAVAESSDKYADTTAAKSLTTGRPVAAQQWLSHSQTRITFANGSSALSSAARKILDGVAYTLLSAEGQDFAFSVEGHANAVGQAAFNQSISEQRAAAVTRYLIKVKGVSGERLAFSAGKGISSPVNPNPVSAANRCVIVTLKKH